MSLRRPRISAPLTSPTHLPDHRLTAANDQKRAALVGSNTALQSYEHHCSESCNHARPPIEHLCKMCALARTHAVPLAELRIYSAACRQPSPVTCRQRSLTRLTASQSVDDGVFGVTSEGRTWVSPITRTAHTEQYGHERVLIPVPNVFGLHIWLFVFDPRFGARQSADICGRGSVIIG